MNAIAADIHATDSAAFGDLLHHCVACGGERIEFWRHKDYQYTAASTQQRFQIYRCADCGTGFLNRPPHRSWLEAIYQYSGQALTESITLDEVMAREAAFPNCTVDAKRMADQADAYNRTGNHRALDIGSGFGFYTRALRLLGYRTVSINPGAYENEVFQGLNGCLPQQMLFEQYHDEQAFGVVVMSQVLEHMLEPDQAIAKVANLLERGGILACAVPNYASFLVKLLGARENACLWVPEHVSYFTERGLRRLLARHGFELIKAEQITRVPFDAISRRLGLSGWAAKWADGLVRYAQLPLAALMNALGLGIYINVYAVKTGSC